MAQEHWYRRHDASMDMSSHPLLSAVDDPPPFPASYSQLVRLDKSVVCPICKEPFDGPVSVTCGHSFCSQCIRSSLDVMKDKKCPVCDASVTEGSIRRNRALEEITDSWSAARPVIMKLCQTAIAGPSRKRPALENGVHSSGSVNKKAREDSASSVNTPDRAHASDADVVAVEDEPEELSENDLGECPLCQAKLPISSIPMHIERGCPPPKTATALPGNQKADWKRVFSGAGSTKEKQIDMDRIRKPNYAIAQPGDLRKILSEYGLSTSGDKAALTWRVQQWIILFNANLDTSHPQSLSALRAKLNTAESSRKRDKEKGRDEAISELATPEGMANYAKGKRSEFERLRQEIMERDKRRVEQLKGTGAESPIEVD